MVGELNELMYAQCSVKFLEYGKCPGSGSNNNTIIFIIITILETQRSQGPERTRVDMVTILSRANGKD